MLQRRIARTRTAPPLSPGFAGPGHLAAQLFSPVDFPTNDPFIALMDDHLDIGTGTVGGAHPHAGFETVTLLLEGAIYDRDEGGTITAGEVQWMTAGRGIIHGENVGARGKVRLLQLWLTLPRTDRWTTPAFQDVRAGAIPVRREAGVEVRVYSGASGDHRARTRNHVPVTLTETRLDPDASFEQDLPASYNGVVIVVSGSARFGSDAVLLEADQIGWLDRPDRPDRGVESLLRMAAGPRGARVVLYAGPPQGDPIVSHGPFIGDTREDIVRLYSEYRAGRFPRMSDLARAAP